MGILKTPKDTWLPNQIFFDIPKSINEYLELGNKLMVENRNEVHTYDDYHKRFAVLLANHFGMLSNWGTSDNFTITELAGIQDILLKLARLNINIAITPNFQYGDGIYSVDSIPVVDIDKFIKEIKNSNIILYSVNKQNISLEGGDNVPRYIIRLKII